MTFLCIGIDVDEDSIPDLTSHKHTFKFGGTYKKEYSTWLNSMVNYEDWIVLYKMNEPNVELFLKNEDDALAFRMRWL
jgi:hypothetical protein